MPICETCGTTYTPKPEALECPRCTPVAPAEPEAQRPLRTRPAGAPAASSASGVRRSAVPPGAPAPKAAAPGPNPSAPNPSAPKTPAPAPRPAAVAKKPAAPAPRASAPPPARPAPRIQADASPIDQTTKVGLLITLGLAVVVGIVVIIVWRKRSGEERERVAHNQEVQALFDQINKLSVRDAAEAERIIKIATDKETVWRDHTLAVDIQSIVTRAKAGLSSAKEEQQAMGTFSDMEKELEKSDLAVARLRDLRRQLDESEAKLSGGGPEIVARLAIARKKADESYAIRLLDEAKSTATLTEGSTRPGLIRYQTVEDELKTLLDRAHFQKNEEQKGFYTPLYKRALEEGDALAVALFTAEGDKIAWTDCLAAPQDGYWNPSNAKGFSHKVEKGTLLIIGPDADANQQAVISIGDREQWRHFQLDLAFTIEKGNIDLAFRLGKGVNTNTLSYPLYTSGESSRLKPGKPYSARISVIGSRLDVRFAGDDIDTPSPYEEPVNWTKSRKGALGLIVSPEARARFTRFQVRELR